MIPKLPWLAPIISVSCLAVTILLTQESNVGTAGIIFLVGLLLALIVVSALAEPREMLTTTDDRKLVFIVSSVAMAFAVLLMAIGLVSFWSESRKLVALGLFTICITLTTPAAVNFLTKRQRCYCVD